MGGMDKLVCPCHTLFQNGIMGYSWSKGIIGGIIGVIIAGFVGYYLFQHKKEDTYVNLINDADALLEKNMPEDALTIYNDVLKIVSVDKDPDVYARIRNNEGVCYFNLAEISNKEENLKKAIRAYEEALKIHTIEKYPVNYATTQNNLGSAYGTLALVQDKEKNLKKAIRAYEEALKVYTSEGNPLNYERIMSNLNKAKRILSQYEKD